MINITQAQANQSATDGRNEDWVITLNGEELYKLPSHFSVQETFMVRDIAENMMKLAAADIKEQEQELCLVKMAHIVKKGNAQLDALKIENERLADILQQHTEGA